MGRFISEDPIGLLGGDANLHAYVANTPVNATDPLGLYMEVNDNLIVPYGGYPVSTASPQPWQLGLDDAFPQLVGPDSYRNKCAWGRGFPAHSCDPGETGFRDIGEPVGDALDDVSDAGRWLDDQINNNSSYTWEEATGNAVGFAGAAGLCETAIGTIGRAGAWGKLGAAATCAASDAAALGDTVNDFFDFP